MTVPQHRPRQPNEALARIIRTSGVSRKTLAHHVNQLAAQAGPA
ncbi:hypothetical protein AB0O64_36050 [Streptomyces sp. NPDC088341]